MSENTAEAHSDETASTPADTGDGQLGEAGERTLRKLREEIKGLKAQLKAHEPASESERDATSAGTAPSDGASDSATDADSDASATPAENVKPIPPRFMGTADNGARQAPAHARQLTRNDLVHMSPRAIETARRNGQLRDLLKGQG